MYYVISDEDESSDSEVEEYSGMEQPPLLRQLKGILAEYPDDGQIIKVMIVFYRLRELDRLNGRQLIEKNKCSVRASHPTFRPWNMYSLDVSMCNTIDVISRRYSVGNKVQ